MRGSFESERRKLEFDQMAKKMLFHERYSGALKYKYAIDIIT